MKNSIYLGIDQTGAVDKNGFPKPLPACLIENRSVHFFYLKSLSQNEIKKQLDKKDLRNLLICADCVFGLPVNLKFSWSQALQALENFAGYGRKPAQDYFRHLGQGEILRRKIETACSANSVFQEIPFQKNIQTGTFRIWKELSLNPQDFYIPALEKARFKDQIPLFEGYPSYSWKLIFSSKQRCPEDLSALIKLNIPDLDWTATHQNLVNKDKNLADAFLLALTMMKFETEALKQCPDPEGWILGALGSQE